MSDQFQLRERLVACMHKTPNRTCADCGAENPEWVSVNLLIFVCMDCSGIHRQIGTHISKIRSVKLDMWEEESVKMLEDTDNDKQNAKYLIDVPFGTHYPTQTDSHIMREQWIRGKYERFEFSTNAESYALNDTMRLSMQTEFKSCYQPYIQKPEFYGWMVKKGANVKNWKKRWFVISEAAVMYYYKEKEDFEPAGAVYLKDATLFVPDVDKEQSDQPDGIPFRITPDNGRTYYFVAENAQQMIVWYNAITCALARLDRTHGVMNWPAGQTKAIVNPVREGMLSKEGGGWKSWKKRWFVCTAEHLFYFQDQNELTPVGYIPLRGCVVNEVSGPGTKPNSFSITTKYSTGKRGGRKASMVEATSNVAAGSSSSNGRVFLLMASSDKECDEWVDLLKRLSSALNGQSEGNQSGQSNGNSSGGGGIGMLEEQIEPIPMSLSISSKSSKGSSNH